MSTHLNLCILALLCGLFFTACGASEQGDAGVFTDAAEGDAGLADALPADAEVEDAATSEDAASDAGPADAGNAAIEGNIADRPPCTQVCDAEGLVCDPTWNHFLLGPGGTELFYGQMRWMEDCDHVPEPSVEEQGRRVPLTRYICRCKGR